MVEQIVTQYYYIVNLNGLLKQNNIIDLVHVCECKKLLNVSVSGYHVPAACVD